MGNASYMLRFPGIWISLALLLCNERGNAQLFQDDFGTAFGSISTVNWPTSCRNGASSFNTSLGACAGAGDYEYSLSGFGNYITTSAIAIPATGYTCDFEFEFNNSFSFPAVEIRSVGPCGTSLLATETLSNTSGACTPHSINLDAYAGQTIYLRFRSNTSSATFYFDQVVVDLGGGGGPTCLLDDDFGTAFTSISTTNWPTACRSGASSFNTSTGPCSGAGDYSYAMNGFVYITSLALAIPATGWTCDFDYSFNQAFSFPSVEIRTGASCGTSLVNTETLTNTGGACTPHSINLDAYASQTIYLRFRSNSSLQSFYIDNVRVCGNTGTPGIKWADNFNDNDLVLDYLGNDGDEDCPTCGNWVLAGGASLNLVPAGGWNGNSNETEAFPANMSNVYYVRLDRNEYIESPTIDLTNYESVKISFYAKSSSPGTGGGDTWSFSDRLRLQFWDGSTWQTIHSLRDDLSASWSGPDDFITAGLPFNYYCFTGYKSTTSPGNYYYSSSPNVNAAMFHSSFKFRVIFEGGFSGSPFAWVDDFTFRADADGYSTCIPCGISFWNQPSATSYGQDAGTSGNNNAEKGVELELDNSINIPPNWATEADDGDQVSQVFGVNESERVVFSVLSEQEINFAFPRVHFYAPSMGWQSSTMSIDNSYSGPGWKYYAVEYVSCDLAGGSIAEPTDDYQYYFSFEYGNEFIPVFYQLNTSGIEYGGGVTSLAEVFNAPDVVSTDNCGVPLPITLLDFNAVSGESSVFLDWQTGTEINNSHFSLQRSSDATDFREIAKITGAGNSTSLLEYDFEDKTPVEGWSYYRLQQVDFDGTTSFSNVEAVYFEKEASLIHVFPNPANDMVTVEGAPKQIETLSLFDMLGKEVTPQVKFTKSGTSVVFMDISALPEGVYLLKGKFATTRIQKL